MEESHGAAESGGCARGIVTSSNPSAWPWLRCCTTRTTGCTPSTALHGARPQPPGPERERSASCTTAYGHRSDLFRGCGQHCSSRCSRRGVWSGTSWRILRSSHRWCLFLKILCRRRWTQCWSSSVLWTCRLLSRSSRCPRSPLTVSRSVWWSGGSLRW